MMLTAEQLEQHNQGIGASEIACLFPEAKPYMDMQTLWEIKTGLREPEPPSRIMVIGSIMEGLVRSFWTGANGEKVAQFAQQIIHPSHNWLRCFLDGILQSPNYIPVEIKCPTHWGFNKTQRDGLPANWILQGQQIMSVTEKGWVRFLVANQDDYPILDAVIHGRFGRGELFCFMNEIQIIEVMLESDPEIQAEIIRRGGLFWNHVQSKIPFGPEDLDVIYGSKPVFVADVTPEAVIEAEAEFESAKQLRKEANELYARSKAKFEAIKGVK